MNRLLLCSFWALSALPLSSQSAAPQTADEIAVRQVVEKYMIARERRDPKAIEALFTKDADQLVSSGEWRKGRDEVVRGTLASSQRSGGNRSIAVEAVRFVAPGVALADGRYELSALAGGESRKMWTTLVVTKGVEGWRIAAIRNMLPAPANATTAVPR